MRYFKTLGIAIVATAALTGFVGVGAASATVLCKVEPTGGNTGTKGTTCPEGSAYPSGTEIHAVVNGSVTFENPFKTLECKKSTWTAATKQEGGASETVSATVGALTFGECSCELKTITPGTFEFHWVPDTLNGTATSSGAEFTSTCSTIFGIVHCIFVSNATDLGTLTGGYPAALDIEGAHLSRVSTNPICPESSPFTAKYEITTPKPLYIAAET
ncbi:MAG TPA: hypothetical protein VFJ65_03395 [Solirubrobacterales bacterium]|nr:hypothetical protein [Solirubrobacterales bacterium]